MAYTLEQSTTGVQGAADDLIYVVKDSTNTGEINYRYICIIKDGATELIRLKQLPNNAGATVFNIKSIVSNYVEQDECPYRLGQIDLNGNFSTTTIFATNTKALVTFSLEFGYEFSVAAGDVPTETLVPSLNTDVICVNGNFLTSQQTSPDSNAAVEYKLIGPAGCFLTDIPSSVSRQQDVLFQGKNKQFMSMAFLNGDDVGSTDCDYMHVSYFNGTTALNTGYIQNEPPNGGAIPAPGLSDSQSLLYVGVGTQNLDSQVIDSI